MYIQMVEGYVWLFVYTGMIEPFISRNTNIYLNFMMTSTQQTIFLSILWAVQDALSWQRQWDDIILCTIFWLACPLIFSLNSLRLWQNGSHFVDDIFKCIFLSENVWISIEISLKFVPKGAINNIPALVQIMALCRPGDKPLSEAMMVNLPMHICVFWPQWVNTETGPKNVSFLITMAFWTWSQESQTDNS